MKSQTLKNKIIVILGPTASGKSELAVKLAHRFNGEIISADSRQVYKELDIGTAKVKGKWESYPDKNKRSSKIVKMGEIKKVLRKVFVYKKIPHYCLDITSPKKVFTAIDFKKCAQKAIKDILARGKLPIICGGTGFYIDVLLGKKTVADIPPNWKLRKKLEKKSTEELFKMLKKLNPERAKNIDKHNPRRLIRAIEITKASNMMPKSQISNLKSQKYLLIGIKLSKKELKRRIERRVKKILRDGLLGEIKKLRKQGLSWKRFYELGFEYKYPVMFLQNKINREEMFKKMVLKNWHYAKRQMTWFSAQGRSASGGKEIKWINKPEKALDLVKKFIY